MKNFLPRNIFEEEHNMFREACADFVKAARASRTATGMPGTAITAVSAAASMAPTMTIAEIALVTAISGVCRAGVTFQTTW